MCLWFYHGQSPFFTTTIWENHVWNFFSKHLKSTDGCRLLVWGPVCRVFWDSIPFLFGDPQSWPQTLSGIQSKSKSTSLYHKPPLPFLPRPENHPPIRSFCKDKPEFAYNPLNRGRDFGPLDLTATVIYCRWVDSLVPWFSVSERKSFHGQNKKWMLRMFFLFCVCKCICRKYEQWWVVVCFLFMCFFCCGKMVNLSQTTSKTPACSFSETKNMDY